MSSIGEFGYYAKVATTSANAPEKVCILLIGSHNHTSIGDGNSSREQVVQGKTMFSSQESDPTTSGQAPDTFVGS